MKRFFLLSIVVLLVFSACRKENIISTDPSHKLVFSADTVIFDTVFTSLGSSTHQLKIYNNYDEDLNITEVRLMGGEQSRFKITFDGEAGTAFYAKIIPANAFSSRFQSSPVVSADGIRTRYSLSANSHSMPSAASSS